MITTLKTYLEQKFATFNYLQAAKFGVVHGGENKYIGVNEGNEEVLLNLDTYQSLAVILNDGQVTTDQKESAIVANEYEVTKVYPFKVLVYYQGDLNTNSDAQAQLIADSIQKSITGRQVELLASTNLVNAYIEIKRTNYNRHLIYDEYFTGGGLQEKDILIEIEFEFEINGNQDCFVDSPCDDDDFVFSFDAPLTFCEKVNECLGISDGGSATLVLNQQGDFIEQSGGGGVVLEVTKAEFLALVADSDLSLGTYKITDVENGLFIETLSANTYNEQGVLSLFIPDYSIAPQLVMGQSVSIGDKYSWGGQIWENTTGNNPPEVSQLELESADWDLIPKSLVNDYVAIQLNVTWNGDIFTFANQANTQNQYAISETYSTQLGGVSAIYGNQWTDNISQNTNLTLNNKIDGTVQNNTVQVSGNIISVDGGVANNFGDPLSSINNNEVGALSGISNNELSNGSVYELNILTNGGSIIKNFSVNAEIAENEINGSGSNIGYNFQHDASDIKRNIITGSDSFIQAVQQNNNSELNDNILTGDNVFITGFSQLCFDKFNGNSFIGNDINVIGVTMNGYGEVSGFDIQASNFHFWNIELTNAILKNFTYTSVNIIKKIYLSGCTVENGADIWLEDFTCDHDLDLTGFSVDIVSETIQSGKGWFTFTHNFGTSPLTAGSSELHNLIPTGARITNLTASGTLTGTSIEIGLETDDEGLISEAVGLLPLVWIGQSVAATANRSLKIKAVGGDITAGELKVKVEFVL